MRSLRIACAVACAACNGASQPPGPDTCSATTPCAQGYECREGSCYGRLTLSGTVDNAMPVMLPDEMTVYIVPFEELRGGLDCAKAVAKSTRDVVAFPSSFAIEGVPPGELWAVAAFPRQPVDGLVYAGTIAFSLDASGRAEDELGNTLDSLTVVIDGGMPYACE